ncbi:MAG TPA: hypothetical protein VL359_08680, partial [bacterium]|nr:hypothetical protein [bacterium]
MSRSPAREESRAVGGEFAVTGRLPTLSDVMAFKEGTSSPDFGYYRYVSHPYLRRIQEDLQQRFDCRHCRLAESREVALLELLLCLGDPAGITRFRVISAGGARSPLEGTGFFSPSDAAGFQLVTDVSELRRGDILVLALPGAGEVPPAPAQEARRAAESGASVVVVLAESPPRPPRV